MAMSRIPRLVKDAQNYALVTKTKNIASNIPWKPFFPPLQPIKRFKNRPQR
jgi:hypothetical protein